MNIPHSTSTSILACSHCGSPSFYPIAQGQLVFCCHGCQCVFNILKDHGFDQKYYELRSQQSGSIDPVEIKNENFLHFNDDQFISEFVFFGPGESRPGIDFYVEGVHCLACLWLLEKTPQFVPGVLNARLDFSKSILHLQLAQDFNLSSIAQQLSRFGHLPHPIHPGGSIEQFRKKEERTGLLQIGIAGACLANIMLYSISIYAGADGHYLQNFGVINLLFSLPVVLYSAIPFYRSAWSALIARSINIDVPVALGILVAFFSSVYQIYSAQLQELYFDSLASLTFLLLLSRYFVKKATQKGLDVKDLGQFFQNGSVLKLNSEKNGYEKTHAKYLRPQDLIQILSGEVIPADGRIFGGEAYINSSLLTGESMPIAAKNGEQVFAGTAIQGGELFISVEALGADTRMGQLLQKVESFQQKSYFSSQIDQWTRLFLWLILALAIGTLLYFSLQQQSTVGLKRALSLIIICCPCALGLATPLALTKALGLSIQLGIIPKHEHFLESLAGIKNVILDKTGTITTGSMKVGRVYNHSSLSQDQLAAIIWALESQSLHPMAQALREWSSHFPRREEKKVKHLLEIPGLGVQGNIEDENYLISRADSPIPSPSSRAGDSTQGQIALYHISVGQKKLLATLEIEDHIRPDSPAAIKSLQEMGLKVKILSGDQQAVVERVAQQLGIDPRFAHAEMSPEEKAQFVQQNKNSLMVGDGANDALALQAAEVGIAVRGSVDLGLRASDAFLTKNGITPLFKMIFLARSTLTLIKRNIYISLAYNFFAAYAALSGQVTPLWAAVFMPLSSLSVLLSSLYGTKEMRALSREDSR